MNFFHIVTLTIHSNRNSIFLTSTTRKCQTFMDVYKELRNIFANLFQVNQGLIDEKNS